MRRMSGLKLAFILFTLIAWPAAVSAADPVAELVERIKNGGFNLDFEPRNGYLMALLKVLNIPVSSQTLVFSKTSLQTEGISLKTPRALYFNDDSYVAWVRGTSLELMSVDPERGASFYMLAQENDGKPEFERITGHICTACHYDQSMKKFVPRLTFSSVVPDENGGVEGTYPLDTTDSSPMEQRWGGWYVTGTHGSQRHLGNIALKTPRSPSGNFSGVDFSKSSNVTDLSMRIDVSRYPSPGSDIVALLVLAHQADVQNLITLAGAKTDAPVGEVGEQLVKAMLFSGAAPFKEPIKGTSSFATDFAARGPRDHLGRSLRDFDLKTRIFRYPLSYMIYTKSFDQMPDSTKKYVYRRLTQILTGADSSKDFANLSQSDRTAILEILRETKSDFR